MSSFFKSRYRSRSIVHILVIGGLMNILALFALIHYLSIDGEGTVHPDGHRQRPRPSRTEIRPEPTLPPVDAQHIIRAYDGDHNPLTNLKSTAPFNISTIFDLSSYTSSISNHYTPLYSNTSNQHLTFYHLKPQCVRRHSEQSICFLSDCHDTDPQSNFNDKMTSLHQSFLVPHSDPDSERSSRPKSIADRDHFDEENAILPRQWLQYGTPLNTINAFNRLMYRPDSIRHLQASKSTACFISHRHRFVFLHVLKSGGTSMIGFLTYALCSSTDIKDCNPLVFKKISCKKHGGRNPEYFRFAIVRNPYNRMFSLWSHQFTMGLEKMKNPRRFKGAWFDRMKRGKSINKLARNLFDGSNENPVPKEGDGPDAVSSMDDLNQIPNEDDRIEALRAMDEGFEEQIAQHIKGLHSDMFARAAERQKAALEKLKQRPQRRLFEESGKLTVEEFSRFELLQDFAAFVWEKRFIGGGKRGRKKTGVSTDHMYCQSWWLFNNQEHCPVVDFVGHLETIDFDIQHIMNLIVDNQVILDYFVENGEYWKVNTFGSTLKQILYNNSREDSDEMSINSLTDIYKFAAFYSDIAVQRWTAEL